MRVSPHCRLADPASTDTMTDHPDEFKFSGRRGRWFDFQPLAKHGTSSSPDMEADE
jgi:hypothetical protein